MNRIACKYAILRFVPYPETGEFANVGVVVVAPKSNEFEFLLETRKTQRLTHFFEHLDRQVYRDAIAAFYNELDFLKQQVINGVLGATDAFSLIAQPRETMLAFGEARGALIDAENTQQITQQLFAHYAEREFAKQPNYEAQLQAKVKKLVRDLDLKRQFVQASVEDKGLEVKFELAQLGDNDVVERVIKPLSFQQDEARAVFNHADTWLAKLRRLEAFDLLPKDLIFPFEEIAKGEQQAEAIEIVKADFKNFGDVVAANDDATIREFAEK